MSQDPAPYYDAHLFICTNTRPEGHPRGSCARSGGEKLRDYMKARAKELGLFKKIRVNSAGCLDRCELGPVMVIYPEGVWYSLSSREDVDRILIDHVKNGGRVADLMLDPDDRLPADLARRRGASAAP